MDGRDFDNWARKLARLRSRRDLLKAGIGAVLAGGVLAGRGVTPFKATAQGICDGAPADTSCGTGCGCASAVGGGGTCFQSGSYCGSPDGCNSNADCPTFFICATNNASLNCAPSGSAGICVLPCFIPATTTTTTTTAAPTTTTTAAPTTTTTAAPTTTTTAAPTTTTTATPTTTTTAAPTTTTTTTAGPSTTTTTTTAGPTTTTTTTTSTTAAPPRIRVTPSTVQRGQTVTASVTGFGPAESVRIRWRVGTTFVQVGTLTTGTNGSGSTNVIVPANAAAGANSVRADGTAFSAQTNAVTVVIPPPAAVTINPTRGTVNTDVDFTVANFPFNAAGTITWRRTSGSLIDIGTFQTNASGAASGSFPVPATPGGPGQVITFTAGGVSKTATFEVAPRIKVATGAVGDMVDVSLRGFGRQEQGIRIRWLVNGSYIQVGTANASNTGSANVNVTIPPGATVGANSVRGDGPQFRAQTNAAIVTA